MTSAADLPNDRTIVGYWSEIASTWTSAIRSGGIASRELVTNRAIIQSILDRSPRSVLDLGCGEGWLCRELLRQDIQVIGVDAIPELIAQAQAAGPGDFRVISYEDVSGGGLETKTDVVVCNFSLLGKDSVEGVFRTAPSLIAPGGALIVQTLHPLVACGEEPYEDGWRLSPWTGFSPDFAEPSPWYFRTLESWIRLFAENGLRLVEIREPLHPETLRPASAIFIATVD